MSPPSAPRTPHRVLPGLSLLAGALSLGAWWRNRHRVHGFPPDEVHPPLRLRRSIPGGAEEMRFERTVRTFGDPAVRQLLDSVPHSVLAEVRDQSFREVLLRAVQWNNASGSTVLYLVDPED